MPEKHDGSKFNGGMIRKEGRKWYGSPGDLVVIRSVKEEHGDETRLAVYIGEWYDDNPGTWFHERGNPTFYVFGINTFIRGFESWWKNISKADLQGKTLEGLLKEHEITRQTIQATIKKYLENAVTIGQTLVNHGDSRNDTRG